MLEAKRTLVKSVPELWADVSDPDCLARHLGAFEGVRITRIQPDSRVEWEGEHGSGHVELRSSGFGTRVTLVAQRPAPPGASWWSRLRRRVPPPEPLGDDTVLVVLTDMLDALGRAHHRPFSRA